jgi:hypothetical protein
VDGSEFKDRRERLRLTVTQVADRLKISTATVRNWESEATPIPVAVEMLWEVWEPRFRKEDPLFGPLTLIYADGPMFIDPQGPRRPLAMMRQEPYLTNAAAIARVGALWGRSDFHNPLIIDQRGDLLWNAIELAAVIRGEDAGAPTIANLLRAIAGHVRANSAAYVRSGPKLPDADEVRIRQAAIESQASELDALAATDPGTTDDQAAVEAILGKLRSLGMWPPDPWVSGIASAFHVRAMS